MYCVFGEYTIMMDVHCPQCGTVFEFDERLMRGVSATLQCSVCQHVFTIRASHRQAEQENQPRWMVRTHHSGDILYFRGFDELHKWILERKIDQQDEISRTGRKWTVLADIGEFAPIFQVVESISQLTDPPPSKAPKTEVPDAVRDRQLTMQQFPNRSLYDTPAEPAIGGFSNTELDEVSEGELRATTEMQRTTREAAFAGLSQPIEPPSLTPAALEPSFTPETHEPEFVEPPAVNVQEQWSFGQAPEANNTHSMMTAVEADEPFEERPKRTGLIVAVVLLLALAAGAGYLFAFERERVDGWLGLKQTAPVTQNKTKSPKAPKVPEKPPEPAAPEWMVQTQAGVHKALGASESVVREAVLAEFNKTVSATHDVVFKAHKKALRSVEKELMKSDIKLVLKKAKKALRSKKANRARALYHQALEIDSHNVKAIVGLGWSLLSLGNPGAAAAQFKKALHVNSLSEDAYIGLGKAERARGNLKAALSAYDNYLERFPTGKKASIARYQRKQLRAALGM